MSSRLRNLNSTKISFFAFQDIITSVSGILVLVTLLLATSLERPAQPATQTADPELENKLVATLRQQAEIDARNQNLQSLLTAAETAPSVEKLESDITRLHAQLADEKSKHAGLADQLAASQSILEARDRTLGLVDLKVQIQHTLDEAAALSRLDSKVREEMARLDQRVASIQSKILKLREREGKLWLIPDKSSSSKEPILVTVNESGAKAERFDHPEQTKEFPRATARTDFDSYLAGAKPLDQYVVFLVKPSGIDLFQRLVKVARDKGFEVGFDALEENRETHFTTPPPLDDTPPPAPPSGTGPEPTGSTPPAKATTNYTPSTSASTNPISTPISPSQPAPAPKAKSWWQRFLEFVGVA